MANKKQTATFNGIKDGKILDIMPKTTTDNVLLPDGTRLTDKIKYIESKINNQISALSSAINDETF